MALQTNGNSQDMILCNLKSSFTWDGMTVRKLWVEYSFNGLIVQCDILNKLDL